MTRINFTSNPHPEPATCRKSQALPALKGRPRATAPGGRPGLISPARAAGSRRPARPFGPFQKI